MALTSKHDLPYPLPTADVRMGAADIQALAQAVAARLSGALFRATVAAEPVADTFQDKLNLNLTVDDSTVFTNAGVNSIRYIGGDTVVATLYAQVTWAQDGVGSRQVQFLINDVVLATQRLTPDGSDAFTMTMAWPVKLADDDVIALQVWQNSGAPLNVNAAKFRCVVHGIQPA